MKKFTICIFAFAAFLGGTLLGQNQARDITGTWQGTLHAGTDLRTVLKISKADGGALKAVFYSIDQGGQAITVSSISVQGSTVKFAVAAIGGNYEGKLSNTDGTTITGTWTQGPNPLALELTLANDKTAWTIPEPPPPQKMMAADANPGFEVATIKPAKEGGGTTFRVGNGGLVTSTNTSLSFLIQFAYGIHPRQLAKGPAWIETEKYDIVAKPDTEGIPGFRQLMTMVQKLVADRFQLTFHNEKKELPVYAITVAKTGAKLTLDESNPNGLPGYGGDGRGGMRVVNSTIAEFASFALSPRMEQPVVDQTGLGSARYDFVLKFTPDAAVGAPPPPANPDAPPDIFAAMLQQLGLKMESTKALVDVFVIDHVEKPSDN
jgi:uncharacterized protein (TIGR03435 family)